MREDPEIPERLEAVLSELRVESRIGQKTEWRIVKAWTKRKKKLLFELEQIDQQGRRRLVGRVVRADRNRACFQALEILWAAGLRPPAAFTVPRPIGHSATWEVILQEKAPGDLLDQLFVRDAGVARRSAAMAGEWLNALHSLPLEVSDRNNILPKLDVWCAGLKQLSPQDSSRLDRIHQQIAAQIADEPANLPVPSHGDFHATNILVSETGRVTAIDFDNFGGRERAADVGYFLGQTAARGFRKTASYRSTADIRASFVESYAAAAGAKMPTCVRIGSHAGATFLRLLHDDLCLMKSGRTDLIGPWLIAAELFAGGGRFD